MLRRNGLSEAWAATLSDGLLRLESKEPKTQELAGSYRRLAAEVYRQTEKFHPHLIGQAVDRGLGIAVVGWGEDTRAKLKT
jgi:hypothetical protein